MCGSVEHLKANCPEKLQNQVKNERKHVMSLTYFVLISKKRLRYKGVVHTTLDTGIYAITDREVLFRNIQFYIHAIHFTMQPGAQQTW